MVVGDRSGRTYAFHLSNWSAVGGIFCYDAPFFGSMGGHLLNKPVIAVAGR
ncbi:MAG TPA: hypothetical protein VHS57_03365 [Acidimicrobiales bacterium]|nr:hypothetical protein [Acidimicrobiales bacterium]